MRITDDVGGTLHSCAALRRAVAPGFYRPPKGDTLPVFDPSIGMEIVQERESLLVESANYALRDEGAPPLRNLYELYSQTDDFLPLTFKELDHFPDREPCHYYGVWPMTTGRPCRWPKGEGPRIFAYLKPFEGLTAAVEQLAKTGYPTIIHFDSTVQPDEFRTHAAPNVLISREPVDLSHVAPTSDLAILNGTHATTAAFLLAGKPTIHIPLTKEQELLATRCFHLGVSSIIAPADVTDNLCSVLSQMNHDAAMQGKARTAMSQYGDYSPEGSSTDVVNRLAQIAR